MESRIKMLREKRGLIQELLAVEIGVTQQMLSKYEKDITIIKVDVLKRIAEYFNGKRLNFRHGYKNPRPHFCNRSTLIIHI